MKQMHSLMNDQGKLHSIIQVNKQDVSSYSRIPFMCPGHNPFLFPKVIIILVFIEIFLVFLYSFFTQVIETMD